MDSHNIFFRLNPTESVIITLEDPIEYLHPCYEEYIVFSQNKTTVRLADGPIYHNMLELTKRIRKALSNELQLHTEIKKDIGYLYNEYHYDENDFDDDSLEVHISENNFSNWTGYPYYVWMATLDDFRLVTWIYNDTNCNIIFEVTPFYPYMYCEPEEEPNYIPYDEWIKTYRPYLIRTLSREIAQEWLNQAEFLIKTMDEYVRKWEEAQK